jgi:hypothetical protein|tara:strand:+ start:1280 stop:1717 length:438 start_codon:yes stop_codon:yes gene_type:complete
VEPLRRLESLRDLLQRERVVPIQAFTKLLPLLLRQELAAELRSQLRVDPPSPFIFLLLRFFSRPPLPSLAQERCKGRENVALHARITSSVRSSFRECNLLHPNASPLPKNFNMREHVLELKFKRLHLNCGTAPVCFAFLRCGAHL